MFYYFLVLSWLFSAASERFQCFFSFGCSPIEIPLEQKELPTMRKKIKLIKERNANVLLSQFSH